MYTRTYTGAASCTGIFCVLETAATYMSGVVKVLLRVLSVGPAVVLNVSLYCPVSAT